jgi:hypothetical protein
MWAVDGPVTYLMFLIVGVIVLVVVAFLVYVVWRLVDRLRH